MITIEPAGFDLFQAESLPKAVDKFVKDLIEADSENFVVLSMSRDGREFSQAEISDFEMKVQDALKEEQKIVRQEREGQEEIESEFWSVR